VHKNFSYVAILAWMVICPVAWPQNAVNIVRVFSSVPDAPFRVDGELYYAVAEFAWTAGSTHTITFREGDVPTPETQFKLMGVTTNLDESGAIEQPLTASPGLQWVKMTFEKHYQLSISMPDCVTAPSPCPSPGRIDVNGKTYDQSVKLYIPANDTVKLGAYPNTGFTFTNWLFLPGLPPVSSPDLAISFQMTRPILVAPQFQLNATAKTAVNLQANPPSMTLLIDGNRLIPPMTLDWGWGTVHTIGVEPVQSDSGVVYAFTSWSDGGAATHSILVPSSSKPIELMAQFVPAHTVRFDTSPAGLKLSVDNRENWPNYVFSWAPGSIHTISAPATQTDAQGRKYRFVSWSNSQSASFSYTAGPAPGGDPITATYQLLGQATITSQPLNLPVQVDGVSCNTPCAIERDLGASVRVSVTRVLNGAADSRLLFRGWSDSTNDSRIIELSGQPRTYTATYSNQNRLSISASPAEGAAFTLDPASADGFYDASSLVSVRVSPALGFRVRSWSGDISGSSSLVTVALNVPRAAVLALDRLPAIAPLGIRSAATLAAADGVTPGSLISIFGANLAPALELGPANPLSQTLQTVTVRVDGVFLPLVFVSPGQINAQLPAGIAPGAHQLVVRWEGKPETSAPVLVTRNAPGLFGAGPPNQIVGYFVRASGEVITPDRPAHAGEVISVLGTGFGPYTMQPPDAFLLDETAGYTLVDNVIVTAGDATLNVLYAGRSSAGVGLDAVRFQLIGAPPDSGFLSLKISVNGQESNTVLLPISQ
jgi:uncharacterized protein (TIGR03437 family)